ncbi:immunoglobulin-like domain-containing protein [Stigmatella aurantiaca]|uniref:immunoglobulin-like domain-containing protein n=1 Tax=Stigmatella aurantiaca TaxID=41 RepID=UPI0002DE075B|nr:immunoglobulin-like domain-containing protein [Stigmatella aurantiaca]
MRHDAPSSVVKDLKVSPVWAGWSASAQESFLKFDLSSIPEGAQVTSATLQATAYDGMAYGGNGNTYAHFVANDAWISRTLTWDNRPSPSGDPLGGWWIWYDFPWVTPRPEQVGRTETPELAARVQTEVEGDKVLSVRLSSGGYATVYYSTWATDPNRRPKLEIRYEELSCEETTPAPTLTVQGSLELTLECGVDAWQDPGATATDACGPVTVERYNSGEDAYGPGPNANAEGTYSVQYIARNHHGEASAVRTVTVEDTLPPVFQLNGGTQVAHTCGSQWVDPGFIAQDACYGDISQSVQVTGYVNGWVPGTYTVTYVATDSGGNSAPALTRTVEVANCPW